MSEQKIQMEYRNLGPTGLKVSVLSLGGWLTIGGHVDEDTALETFKVAYDAGINFFDTAEGYAKGQSEVVFGRAIKKFNFKRNDIVVSTKIYWGGAFGDNNINNTGLSRKHIIEGTKASLERLGLDYVDIIYAHRPDRETPIEETVRAFNWVIEKGWAFYWGTSEWNAEEITEAWRVADRLGLIGPVVEQPQYNLLARERVEVEYAPLYQKHSYGLTVFSPIKGGFLSGKYNDKKIPSDSRLAASKETYIQALADQFNQPGSEIEKNIEASKRLQKVADKLGVTQAQLALAWVIKNKNVSSAIIGASRVSQIHENLKALEVVKLITPEVEAEIEEAVQTKPTAAIRRF
ncbi:Aldo/keto reductase [Ascobolus immersus RN42]|uniref:Aldo/keto reductase n=1 Tax=Ascobolus immersus RN42 TaxID=1160509 RepID=A0A3N4IH29_ASCIM|nr:Aldo/keto reductase [Ascobolus immersus RN42]